MGKHISGIIISGVELWLPITTKASNGSEERRYILSLKNDLKKLLRKNGRTDFLSNLKQDAKVFDVGCGSNSPFIVKSMLPNCHYTGLDVSDFNHSKPIVADVYILTSPEEFTSEVASHTNTFDAVISSHNLEHCDDRIGTLKAMLKSLKVGGEIYLTFPCEESIYFPNRAGCLNYFDDSTHKLSPPDFVEVMKTIEQNGFLIIYAVKNYSPILMKIIGWLLEPFSIFRKRVMMGTWEYYGFETKIIAKKMHHVVH
jgi:SAM-dependent methyltransferase